MTSFEDVQRPGSRGLQASHGDLPPLSPISPVSSRDGPPRVRQHSTVSALSVEGMRYRRRSRSNTVRTYHEPEQPNWQPGSEPGIATTTQEESLPAALASMRASCEINIIDFSEHEVRHSQADNASLAACLAEERPSTLPCRWISVNGLSGDVINILGDRYGLHPLAIEDLAHPRTRTKVDWYADHACVVLTLQKLVRLHSHKGSEDDCDCSSIDQELEEKLDRVNAFPRETNPVAALPRTRSRRKWWKFWQRQKPDTLPRYLDRNRDGQVDEFVPAHSGLSESTPIRPIRTLHRYESVQVPEHTAFMEKHSVLSSENLAVSVEQVSLFLLDDNLVISFFEHSAGDIEDPIVERLKSPQTMLRRSCDASLMLQAIIDAIVDLAVPVRDAYNRARKELQIDAMTNPNIKTSRALHIFGEEVDMLQNLFRPIVHLVNALRDHNATEPLRAVPGDATLPTSKPGEQQSPQQHRGHHPNQHRSGARDRDGAPKANRSISDFRRTMLKRNDVASSVAITTLAHTYFGDVLDHCITMIQSFEQMDASANNISTLIFNTVGAKTNNFMMILAIVTVLFAPLTFISGYFGMNFASGDGLDHPFSFFWVIALPSLAVFTLLVFATMLWDSIKDFFDRRGIHAHQKSRHKVRK